MTLCEHPPFRLGFPLNELHDFFADEVTHLTDAHQDANSRGDHHEKGEDPLFRGTRYVAVDRVGAWLQGALGQAGHVVALVDVVQDVEEASVKARLDNQTRLQEGK